MRAGKFLLALAITALLTTAAFAQIGGGTTGGNLRPGSPEPATGQPPMTTGRAPPQIQAPVGHRQPKLRDLPSTTESGGLSPEDQRVDHQLNICRGC
jgi:hypothetical protein